MEAANKNEGKQVNQRALVTVVRGYGNAPVANAIMTGVVSREIRMMQAELDMKRRREKDEILIKIAEANERYAIQPMHPIRRSIERMIGFAVLLIADWKERRRCAEKEDDAIWWQ